MAFDLPNVPYMPTKHAPITPSDTVLFQWPTMVLVMNTGNVVALDEDGNSVTYTAVPAWTVLPVTCKGIMATGTTATGLIALYGLG